MIENSNICPYTGLRSFTEEESLYFKGRDEQIDQVARLLEQNKFLMLTGASGEGKSSLIYAGLIPNARAGFFKAKYTNWVVTDFRPERSPVKNMANAVAHTFGAQPATIETELRRGFSSLIDLYVNSSFYTDENDDHWKSLDETSKKNKTRSAANLLIIVDQFEEFFTNPENYLNETPSQDSQVVVNLALETARIALQRNLPVYVVCTMRSDYIGQCSAFRGLPEYIGFSQFFVPRLKRKEIKQVIEEPAVLSGNRITRRLVERLVYDLADGIDQLPILQHALRQVWLAANHGSEEMDLIHYAMVGGMPANELPDADQARYQQWFVQVPETQKKFYADPGLNKIIEIHASRLYEGAWAYYNETHSHQPITQKDAKRIVALTFSCLTKIDDSRAVRNRMSLGEITNIINQTNLTTEVVGAVLNLFRESNNSFIRPYKTEEANTHVLSPDSVLDITHEALIRNWGLLNKWANQEFEFYTTFLDFKKQLLRWKDSGKSSGFLLPLGPLTYFENWYNQCKPNRYWIDRYSEIKTDSQQSLQHSETLLADTKEFIKRSASKVMVTRAFMKYGARRIAVGVALLAMVLMTGFYWYDSQRKTNSRVESLVMEKAHQLLQSKEVSDFNKATYLLIEERLKNGSLLNYLSGLTSAKQRVEQSIASYRVLLYFDKHSTLPLKTELMDRILSELKSYEDSGQEGATFLIEQQNQFLLLLAYDEYYNPSARVADEVIPTVAQLQFKLVEYFFTTNAAYKQFVPTELNLALQLWLTFGNATSSHIKQVLTKVSPFTDSASRRVFDHYYIKGNYEANGRIPSDYNGGYHTMASLYAAAGDAAGIIQCFEQLPESYFRSSLFNNYNNVLGYLYQYNHVDATVPISKWLVDHYPSDDPLTVYRNTVIRSGYIPGLFGINLIKNYARSNSGYFHVNLGLGSREQFFAIANKYELLAKEVKDPNERNYLLAMHHKRMAILYSKYLYDRGLPVDQKQMDEWLDKAWTYFKQVSEEHLAGKVAVNYRYLSDGVRTIQSPRKLVFLYPDYRDGFFADRYNTDVFVDHALRQGWLKEFYNAPETIELLHEWISTSTEIYFYRRNGEATGYFRNDFVISDTLLTQIIDFVDSSPAGKSFDKNLPYLLLANRNFETGNIEKGFAYAEKLNKEKLLNSGNKYEYVSQTYFINAMIDLSTHLAVAGRTHESMEMIEKYEPYQKAFFYSAAANGLYDQYNPNAFVFLDSAFKTIERVDYNLYNGGLYDELDARRYTIYVLGKVGGDRVNKLSNNYIKELIELSRVRGIRGMILGTATDGNYYTALTTMPTTLTEDQEMQCYFSILSQIARSQNRTAGWAGMDESLLWEFNYFLAPR
ncbi:MAG: ATP-binding protein [Cyclobacteriaceae bacterium]|jgi:energy-coupling factor transporter ATP-binding protein EcfA2